MTPEQYLGLQDTIRIQIEESVAQSIEKNVNGKIRALTTKMDDYIQSDDEWKQKAQPVIDLGETARGASIGSLWLAGAVITIGGAYEIIRNLFKK